VCESQSLYIPVACEHVLFLRLNTLFYLLKILEAVVRVFMILLVPVKQCLLSITFVPGSIFYKKCSFMLEFRTGRNTLCFEFRLNLKTLYYVFQTALSVIFYGRLQYVGRLFAHLGAGDAFG